MGTPAFAASILERVHAWPGGEVVGVYCQPDRPSGRGHKLLPPPVKTWALEHKLPVFQPLNFKESLQRDALALLHPHILAVAAYGLILPQSVLDIPSIAPLNVHGSLLPLYRGAAPIQRAIMDDRAETGVSIMRMEAGLDTGPVFAERAMPIGDHTAGSLHDALAILGGELLVETMQALRGGIAHAVPQDNALATVAPKLTKADGLIHWDAPASRVHAQVRAVTPWPGARARVLSPEKGIFNVQLGPGYLGPEKALYGASVPAGQWWRLESGELAVATADRFYCLTTVRPESRKEMNAADFANGYLGRGVGACGMSDGTAASAVNE